MVTKTDLEQRLRAIDKELNEIRQRFPAHSVKPPIMMELFALEDEREELLTKIKALIPPPIENGTENEDENNPGDASDNNPPLD